MSSAEVTWIRFRIVGKVGVSLFCGLVLGCQRPAEPAGEGLEAASASATKPPPAPRCRADGVASFMVGTAAKPPAALDDELAGELVPDDELPLGLPFAVELGGAVTDAEGRIALGYTAESRKAIALLSPELKVLRQLDLGKQYADSPPPILSAGSDGMLIVVPGTDASGGTLELRWWAYPKEPSAPRNLHEGSDESKAVGAATLGALSVVAWDDWDALSHRGVIRMVRLDASKGEAPVLSSVSVVSPEGSDAESPVVVSNERGFWLAWLVNAPETASVAAADTRAITGAGTSAGSSAASGGAASSRGLPQRWLELMALDAAGKPVAAAIKVTPANENVAGFDLLSDARGGAYLSWRSALPVLGSEGGRLHLTRVDPSGALQTQLVDDANLGSGLPTLTREPKVDAVNCDAAIWLTIAGEGDDLRLAPLAALTDANGAEQLRAEPLLRDATVLASAGPHLLIAKPRGRRAELSFARCVP